MQNTINNGNLVHLPLPNFAPLGMLKKLKSINHKVHNHEYSGYTKVTKNYSTGFWLCALCAFFYPPIPPIGGEGSAPCPADAGHPPKGGLILWL